MSTKIRSFIALELDKTNQEELHRIQTHFAKLGLAAKWASPKNIHLTLKFLGGIEQTQIDAIKEALIPLERVISANTFTVSSLGAFPSIQHPKVFFAAIEDKNARIAGIVDKIDYALAPEGIAKETREFKPHITLARFNTLKNIERFKEEIRHYTLPALIQIHFNNITFFQSTLTPTGPAYEVLKKFNLRKENRS